MLIVGLGQRNHIFCHPDYLFGIGNQIDFRVSHAVPTNLGFTIFFRRIRPPIGALAHVIVLISTGWGLYLVHEGIHFGFGKDDVSLFGQRALCEAGKADETE